MEKQRILRFPAGFLWGTATSSYQYEGGNTNNQWYRWEQQGRNRTGERCGKAANWWEGAESDFALAEHMGNNALRLSLEWSRIEPGEGHWDSGAIDRYRVLRTRITSVSSCATWHTLCKTCTTFAISGLPSTSQTSTLR